MDGGQSPAARVHAARLDRCVACGSPAIKRWRTKAYSYTRGGEGDAFDIYRCGECETGFLNPPPAPEYLAEIYSYSGHALTAPVSLAQVEDAERRFPNSTVDARNLVRTAITLKGRASNRALDVGSGMGFITREMRVSGLTPTSINPGDYENRVFAEMNGYMPFVGMLDDFQSADQFGVIILSQVLEHMLEPSRVLERLASMLEPEGVLALAVPNFQSAAVRLLGVRENGCLWIPEHVNYFSSAGLRRLVEGAGLRVLRQDQVTRIRHDALSRRASAVLPKGLLTAVVQYGQRPIAPLLNAAGLGQHLNLFATK